MAGRKTTIIIIDDEEDLCFLLSRMLSSQGFQVITSFTLNEGMKAVENATPDWVILDNNLPDGLGWEQSSRILAMSPSVQLINISANPDSTKHVTDRRVHHLIKPIDASSIMKVIQEHAG